MIKIILMLKKNLLLMGRKKEQRKVKLTIGRYESFGMIAFGYNKDFYGSLDVVPYWGTTNDVMSSLIYLLSVVEMTTLGAPSGVTVFVEGYTQSISSSNTQDGDTYSMNNSEGAIRYLTFDPPPTGTWTQRHSNRSRNRVLCRRSSLGGSRC